MSACSASVRSFDDESELTLLNGERFDEDDEYPNEKTVYHIEQKSFLKPAAGILLPSSSCLARSLAALSLVVWLLIPSFLHPRGQRDGKGKKSHPTAYLDGMRGMAAFAVFLCHTAYGTWDITHVYGAGERNENNYFLQLPIVRLIYAGPPMVAIFFVISGFALSYKPIRLMRAQKHEEFMMATTSSAFRRGFRLFLPCFASTFLVACLCQLGFYKQTEEFAQSMRAIQEDHQWTEPTLATQLIDWAHQMFDFVNVFDWSLYSGSVVLDRHLWTIPAEYRCSLILFLTHIITARMSSKVRLSTLAALAWWGVQWNRWELVPFWGGAFLAEIEYIKASRTSNTNDGMALDGGTQFSEDGVLGRWCRNFFYMSNFICGLFLASFPDADGHDTPGYVYLNSLIPEYWTEKHRFWPTVAAVQIVWSVGNLPCLKKMFTTSLIQYIGDISFPLYVIHGPVIHTFGYMTMQSVYSYTEVGIWSQLKFGFAAAATLIIIVVIWASDIFWRVVDKPCVEFAKWLETTIFIS